MKILMIGPSLTRAKGGIASVIADLLQDDIILKDCQRGMVASCRYGNKVEKLLFSASAFASFLFRMPFYDIFHIHMAARSSFMRKALYIRVLKFFRKPIVLQIHSGAFEAFYDESSLKKKAYISKILNSADIVLALSDGWKKIFDEKIGVKHTAVLPNGIDAEAYSSSINCPLDTCTSFLYMGRLIEAKGVFDLVQAAALLKQSTTLPFTVYIAGSQGEQQLKNAVNAKGLMDCVKLVGWIDDEKKLEMLKQVATVILPSYFEGLPVVLIEGMACGKCIISTNVGAVPDLITDGVNGFLLEPGDVSRLASIMQYVMEHPGDLEPMAQANVQKVREQYDRKDVLRKLLGIYEDVLHSHHHRK